MCNDIRNLQKTVAKSGGCVTMPDMFKTGGQRMKIVFMGTPDFAVPVLEALSKEHEVVCVYTRAPKEAGRGQKRARRRFIFLPSGMV